MPVNTTYEHESIPDTSRAHITTHEIGPRNLEPIPHPLINRVAQVRKTYPREEMDELKRGLRLSTAQNGEGIELLHQLTIVELDTDQCRQYLSLLNRLWNADHSPEQLTPNQHGMFYVLISGHRRDRAIGEIIEEKDWNPWDVTVAANVRHDISLFEAVLMQQAENIHEKPPAHEEAQGIKLLYELGTEEGVVSTLAEYVRRSPYKETKVRDALRYFELPATIHELVEGKIIPYSTALLFVPLVRAYRKYTLQPGEGLDDLTVAKIERYVLEAVIHKQRPDIVSAKVQERVLRLFRQHEMQTMELEQLFGASANEAWEAQLADERRRNLELRRALAVEPLRQLGMLARLEAQASRGDRLQHILTDPEMQAHLARLGDALVDLAQASGITVSREAKYVESVIQQVLGAAPMQNETDLIIP